MTLVKFNDAKKVNGLSTFNELFDSFFNDSFVNDKLITRVPAVNIAESEGHYHIELAAPGLKKEDFKISLDRDVLTISAEKEEKEENRKINRKEYSFSSFVRSFNLPDLIDHANIDASYIDGVLKIDIAKKEEAKFQTREISIK
ncbi:MAG: Hsp20/alpha crystallin family protein [Bacteroidetes bacterium]|nr:Hsp20/alpha crystallin family protein [Bacteroidota bacterium]MBU1485824.1 Hsp20/alpha crystallin family protein [Bacteroidota bacterium]MBU2045746.1 Hsp20/alpha crystallin family protein [Bacteroidota bacterium]MBU2268161.1 Hsp20/alpha crystallin family protein [Bacteroidota bacterium]MBU2376559.1 Hsp20/alpha crystallin family protein [Bacteroidota bacterium]